MTAEIAYTQDTQSFTERIAARMVSEGIQEYRPDHMEEDFAYRVVAALGAHGVQAEVVPVLRKGLRESWTNAVRINQPDRHLHLVK